MNSFPLSFSVLLFTVRRELVAGEGGSRTHLSTRVDKLVLKAP